MHHSNCECGVCKRARENTGARAAAKTYGGECAPPKPARKGYFLAAESSDPETVAMFLVVQEHMQKRGQAAILVSIDGGDRSLVDDIAMGLLLDRVPKIFS